MAQEEAAPCASDAKSKANSVWEQLKSKDSAFKSKADAILQRSYGSGSVPNKNKSTNSSRPEWMISLGMVPKGKSNGSAEASKESLQVLKENKQSSEVDREAARKVAAAALAAVKSGAAGASTVKKEQQTVVPTQQAEDSKAAQAEKRKAEMKSRSSAGLDGLLEQIEKKQKTNILDKSKKDWGEFKDEKGLSEELEAYKKSGDKYLDKVAFLQRADFREYEKERDARLAYQAKRRQGINYQED